MINPDELQDELEEHQDHLQELIMRTSEQDEDIQKLKRELKNLEEDLNSAEADTIPEDEAHA